MPFLPGLLSKLKIGEGFKNFAEGAKSIIKEFHLSPEQELEFQAKIDAEANRHTEAMEAQALKVQELENADRDSAREREKAVVQATGHMDYFQMFVGGMMIVTFFAAVIFIAQYEVPKSNEHIMINALGILEGAVLTIISYYYGSSLGSRNKDLKK